MIRYLKHEEIDKNAWDACILRSPAPLIYPMSWYLDVVSPGWSALVEDNYSRVMPLTHRKKTGINYLFQPPFSQQLGIFGLQCNSDNTQEFLKAIPKQFRFAEIMLNENNPIEMAGTQKLTNITLNIERNIEEIRSGYNDNTRRNIKKANQNNLTCYQGFDIEKIVSLFKNNKGNEVKQSDVWYANLLTLAYQLRHKSFGTTWSAIDAHNEIVAGIFTVEFANRVILLFSGSGPEARDSGAMHFLVDNILTDASMRNKLFDFEGSNNENLARFYMGFGGEKKEYAFVRMNRLPFWMKWIKKR
ncbi:MAG: hypothetical protein CVU11_11060 [Bacteroidetes bacterium HGW-Bacteroidetes-6]|jgi:hypothetical protein|nr:MAG: hypothetical protein CVU11_11060 [Bacteroidetes bacterium HGW-Bacteroidetes-6]